MTELQQLPTVIGVTAHALLKRDGSLKGYRYTAHLEDGSEAVIRNASRLYANAYLYDIQAATGTTGLGGHFTYGKKPQSGYPLVQTFPVEAPATA